MLKFYRWLPAIIVMLAIFAFSSRTSSELPEFGILDTLVKKSGHFIGYAILAGTAWYGFELNNNKLHFAWLIAVMYAFTDEYHQSFIPGRHPSIFDVLFFDAGGAILGLLIFRFWLAKKILNSRL